MTLSDQLINIASQLTSLWFEVILMVGAMLLLIAGIVTKRALIIKGIYSATLIAAIFGIELGQEPRFLFTEVLATDSLGMFMKIVFAGSALWITVFSTIRPRMAEFYFLILAVVAGSSLLLSVNHLLVIYLAIELTSYGAYVLTNFDFEKRSFEAGMKYLLFGGVSSAVSLYGISLIYGFTGTMTLTDMVFTDNPDLLNLGILLFVGGLFFKAGIVPFHLWVPAAYQKAPTEAVAVMAIVPKIGAFVLLHRLFFVVDLQSNQWLLVLAETLGMATIIVGTLGAMRQTHAKRLIAYGAIAHSGFLLAALFLPGQTGLSAFVWYSVVYAVMNLAIFHLLSVYERGGIRNIQDFSGQGSRESYMGGLMVLILVSLIGLPPTAGFTVKFYLFSGMWAWYESSGHLLMLLYLLTAVLSVLFSLFFYLKIPYHYFLKEQKSKVNFRTDFMHRLIATIFVVVLLWMFFSAEILNKITDNINFIKW